MAPYMNDNVDQPYGDWRDEFYEKGYVVLKGVIPKDRALNYRNKMMDWLGSFDNDFDIKEPSTWTKENLPQSFKNGMYLNYCAAHEKYVWEARQYVEHLPSVPVDHNLTVTQGTGCPCGFREIMGNQRARRVIRHYQLDSAKRSEDGRFETMAACGPNT
jgi:hypothetical protein